MKPICDAGSRAVSEISKMRKGALLFGWSDTRTASGVAAFSSSAILSPGYSATSLSCDPFPLIYGSMPSP
jgi:hypothetical protein